MATANRPPGEASSPTAPGPPHHLLVALAGQPNVGKSTVFNLLTGLSQHVGNWAGKTVEKKTGVHRHDGWELQMVDLPGTYSLSASSEEELVARDFLLTERPDVVVVVINAAALERHLYLVAELLPLPVRLVVALNMVDVASREGGSLDVGALRRALGVPVVSMVASRNQGVAELVEAVVACAQSPAPPPRSPGIRADHAEVWQEITSLLAPSLPPAFPPGWAAAKLLEGDREITRLAREGCEPGIWPRIEGLLAAHEDGVLAVASGRYEWIARVVHTVVPRPRPGQVSLTERLDRWLTHPVWGLAALAAVFGLVYGVTFLLGSPLQELVERGLTAGLARPLRALLVGAPPWLTGFIVDGVLAGAGTVASFLPLLAIFFAVLALLEDVGYLARAAYVTDRFMHLIGLHGKSSLPLMLGFGCNVPSIMGARILDSRKARLLTMLLAPLVPCASRMTVILFMAPIFFGAWSPLVAWGLVLLSLGILVALGAVLGQVLLRRERGAFIMELPLYHRPKARTIALQTWQHSVEFLRKAGTVILVFSGVVWAFSYLPNGRIEDSLLAQAGQAMAPLGAWLGLDWRLLVALLSSFFAKENAVATLAVLFAGGQTPHLAHALAGAFTPLAALSFLVAYTLFVPCVPTLATLRQEAGGWRWAALSFGMLLVLSLLSGALVFQGGRLLGLA